MKKFNKKWFTLIEMLIVVVIIGILAAALIPRLTSVKDKANDSARKANLQQLVTAMSAYTLDNGVVVSAAPTTGDTYTAGITAALTGGGMKSIPSDPSNQPQSIYGKSTTGFVYFSIKKAGVDNGAFIFISRAETAGAANYVEGGSAAITSATDSDTLTLCDKVTENATYGACQGPKDKFRIIMKY